MDENQNQDVVIEGPTEPAVETPAEPVEPITEVVAEEPVTEQPAEEPQPEPEFVPTDEGFVTEYEALCQKFNRHFTVQPVFVPNNENTWNVGFQLTVATQQSAE